MCVTDTELGPTDLQGSHECLRRGRVHKVKVDEVVDA